MDQSTEFETIRERHERRAVTTILSDAHGQAVLDRGYLIALVEAANARADKAEAELDAEQVAHLKTRARLTEAEAELAEAKQAALATFRTWLAENGMVVVPRFPTFDMEMAVKDEHIPHRDIYGDLDKLRIEACGVDVWQAMIAAAPDSGLE